MNELKMATIQAIQGLLLQGWSIDALREPWGSIAKRYPVTQSFKRNPQDQPFRPPARTLIRFQTQPFRPSGKRLPPVGRVPAKLSPLRSSPSATSVSPPNGFSRTWSPTRDSPDPTAPSNASFAVSKKKHPFRFAGWKSTPERKPRSTLDRDTGSGKERTGERSTSCGSFCPIPRRPTVKRSGTGLIF